MASSIAPWRPSWSVRARAEWPCSAAAAASSTGCEAPSRNENAEWQWSSTYGIRSTPLLVPAAPPEVPEHDRVAAAGQDQLEVAAPGRARRPPAVLDDPLLEHRLDRLALELGGGAVAAGADADAARVREAADAHRGPPPGEGPPSSTGNGARTARRSG